MRKKKGSKAHASASLSTEKHSSSDISDSNTSTSPPITDPLDSHKTISPQAATTEVGAESGPILSVAPPLSLPTGDVPSFSLTPDDMSPQLAADFDLIDQGLVAEVLNIIAVAIAL